MPANRARPKLSSAPSAEALAAIADPVERAAAVCRIARQCGTLDRSRAEVRRSALLEARAIGNRVAWLARRLGMSSVRISQLTAGASGAPDPTLNAAA